MPPSIVQPRGCKHGVASHWLDVFYCGGIIGLARAGTERGFHLPDYGFADRLGHLTTLTTCERMAIAGLENRERPVKRGAILMRENDANTDLFVLRRGMMASHVLLPDGSRQILRLLFPGDLFATATLLHPRSPETVAALSDSVVASIDRVALAAVMAAHPRVAALLLALGQSTQLALSDRLAGVGRMSAKARIAALLLEIRAGFRRGDGDVGDMFPLVVTQEEIGDATGLTAVHVNRMLRQLERERLIVREGGRVRLLDETALATLANHVDRLRDVDLGWTPAPLLQE